MFGDAGRIEDRGKLLLVLTDSRLTEPRQIADVVVRSANGKAVRVGDVATVTAAPTPQWIRVTADGREAWQLASRRPSATPASGRNRCPT